MPVRLRLTIAFAVMLGLLIVQVAVSYLFSVRNSALVDELIRAHTASNLITRLAVEGQKLRRYEKEYFIYVDNPDKRNGYVKAWQKSHDNVKNQLVLLKSGTEQIWSNDDIARANAWDDALNAYTHGFTRIDISVNNGAVSDTIAANKAIQEAKNKFRVFLNGTSEQVEQKFQNAKEVGVQVEANLKKARLILTVLAVIGVIFGGVVIAVVPDMIARPLRQLSALAEEMSKGKIQQDIPMIGPPEIRELASSLERLRVALRGILQRLQKAQAGA